MAPGDTILVPTGIAIHIIEADNFDSERYQGIPPAAFFFEQHAAYFLFFEKHRAEFFASRELLRDDASRQLFDDLVIFRLLGHLHVRLAFNTPAMRNYQSIVNQWRVASAEETGSLAPLSVFVVPVGEDALCMKCWTGNIAAAVLFRQYYFDRDGVRVAPELGDHVLDVGGCFGDTALFFSLDVGASGRISTFDPMPKHCEIMRANFAMNPLLEDRITLHAFGLSDRNTTGSGAGREGVNPGARLGDDLPCRTLDSLGLGRVDFIKMDVEGSELAALRGGEQTIREWKPKLAVSVYHRPEDFFTIPNWLNSLALGYRFHLGHYSIHHEETVLYAIT
jgi:FkbM family methyltransferase